MLHSCFESSAKFHEYFHVHSSRLFFGPMLMEFSWGKNLGISQNVGELLQTNAFIGPFFEICVRSRSKRRAVIFEYSEGENAEYIFICSLHSARRISFGTFGRSRRAQTRLHARPSSLGDSGKAGAFEASKSGVSSQLYRRRSY